MDQITFNELHVSCVSALQDYVDSAELTTQLLGRCTLEPLPLGDRLSLLLQEKAENDFYDVYTNLKCLIHDAARLGFGYCPN